MSPPRRGRTDPVRGGRGSAVGFGSKQAPNPPSAAAPEPEDKRLERLFDYTKWHIGIYLTGGGGLLALLFSEKHSLVHFDAVPVKLLLYTAFLFIVIAGFAGGVIASSITICRTFDDFWDQPQGPFTYLWWRGKYWPMLEHGAFWISLFCTATALIWSLNARPAPACSQVAKPPVSAPAATPCASSASAPAPSQ